MMEDSEADDHQIFFRPPWESDEEVDLEPPRLRRTCQSKAEPDLQHPLLTPLARAQDALARVETSADVASPAVAEGLRARMAYREASGWLTHTHVWIHPHDLALRDHALTDSCGVAFRTGRLNTEIPSAVVNRSDFETSPSDISVQQALQLARHWRRLAELRTWRPLANSEAVGNAAMVRLSWRRKRCRH
jgi:hypothetical protein